ncbi:MAG: hypothetical protein IJJ29_04085 [Solobacterium sp.]|nr:hypothetical protein [Solobacterium sp.]
MCTQKAMIRACTTLVLVNCFILFAICCDSHLIKLTAMALVIYRSLDHIHATRKYLSEEADE